MDGAAGAGETGGGFDGRTGGVICDAGAPNRIGACPEFIGADLLVPEGEVGAGPDGTNAEEANAADPVPKQTAVIVATR
jgi:hypothetical protein